MLEWHESLTRNETTKKKRSFGIFPFFSGIEENGGSREFVLSQRVNNPPSNKLRHTHTHTPCVCYYLDAKAQPSDTYLGITIMSRCSNLGKKFHRGQKFHRWYFPFLIKIRVWFSYFCWWPKNGGGVFIWLPLITLWSLQTFFLFFPKFLPVCGFRRRYERRWLQ